jgi:hypothetical protein
VMVMKGRRSVPAKKPDTFPHRAVKHCIHPGPATGLFNPLSAGDIGAVPD